MQKRNVHIFRAGNFTLLNGAILPNLEVAYETYGSAANAEKSTILLLHGYTSNPHAAGGGDLDPGWWENLIGPGTSSNAGSPIFLSLSIVAHFMASAMVAM